MNNSFFLIALIASAIFLGCKPKKDNQELGKYAPEIISDDSLLNLVQYQTFQYFWDNAEPVSGLARERTHLDGEYPQNDRNVVTIGGTGFGLMAILVGIERNFITREEGLNHLQKMVNFLDTADRFHGAWPHWLHGETGKVKPFSKKDDGGDLVETAFLVQGLIAVREYFKGGNEAEQALASQVNELWRSVEWDWYTKGGEDVLYWHWSPNHGWDMDFPVEGYNEALIMYILAASSPTHPVEPDVYHKGWAREGAITDDTTYLTFETVLDHYPGGDDPVGPLFWAHYSYLGLDPRQLTDRYGDYFKLNQNHALIHYTYCLRNPKNMEGYGGNVWGLTSSYSPKGYAGHQPTRDLGVISPTAALSSFPYTPEESMAFLKFLYQEADSLVGKYGPYDAFSFEHDWYVERYLAIDQGPIPVMIENYRSGLLWNLFMGAPEIQQGLRKLEFDSRHLQKKEKSLPESSNP